MRTSRFLLGALLIPALVGCGKSDTSACSRVIPPMKDVEHQFAKLNAHTETPQDAAGPFKSDADALTSAAGKASTPKLATDIQGLATSVRQIRVAYLERTDDSAYTQSLLNDFKDLNGACPKG